MDFRSLNIMGVVRITPVLSLAETAATLSDALGVSFKENPPGEFDEFPSFSAESLGISLVLLGIPEPAEQLDAQANSGYTLQIGMGFRTTDAKIACDSSTYFIYLIQDRSTLVID